MEQINFEDLSTDVASEIFGFLKLQIAGRFSIAAKTYRTFSKYVRKIELVSGATLPQWQGSFLSNLTGVQSAVITANQGCKEDYVLTVIKILQTVQRLRKLEIHGLDHYTPAFRKALLGVMKRPNLVGSISTLSFGYEHSWDTSAPILLPFYANNLRHLRIFVDPAVWAVLPKLTSLETLCLYASITSKLDWRTIRSLTSLKTLIAHNVRIPELSMSHNWHNGFSRKAEPSEETNMIGLRDLIYLSDSSSGSSSSDDEDDSNTGSDGEGMTLKKTRQRNEQLASKQIQSLRARIESLRTKLPPSAQLFIDDGARSLLDLVLRDRKGLQPEALRFLIQEGLPVNKSAVCDVLLDLGHLPKPPLLIPWNPVLIQLLLEAGADPFHRTKSGHTLWTNCLKDSREGASEYYNYLFGPALTYVTERYNLQPSDVYSLCCHRGKHVLSLACEGRPEIASAILSNLSIVLADIPKSILRYSGPNNCALSAVACSSSLLDQLNDHDLVDFVAVDEDGESIFDYAARGSYGTDETSAEIVFVKLLNAASVKLGVTKAAVLADSCTKRSLQHPVVVANSKNFTCLVDAICASLETPLASLLAEFEPPKVQIPNVAPDGYTGIARSPAESVETSDSAEPSQSEDVIPSLEARMEDIKLKLFHVVEQILSAEMALVEVELDSHACIVELFKAAAFVGSYTSAQSVEQSLLTSTNIVTSAVKDRSIQIDLTSTASLFLFSSWETEFLRQETLFQDLLEAHWSASRQEATVSAEDFIRIYGELFLNLLGFSILSAEINPLVSARSYFFPNRSILRVLDLAGSVSHLRESVPTLLLQLVLQRVPQFISELKSTQRFGPQVKNTIHAVTLESLLWAVTTLTDRGAQFSAVPKDTFTSIHPIQQLISALISFN